MDTKGGSLPAMPEPKNPTSMKQLSGSPCGCKGMGDGSTDPDLLMDKVAAQLAATPQDGVLQKMSNHNHTHEHLKDLTSRLLNGDQDKMAKFCAAPATSPIHKVVESGPPHGSPQSDSSPEFTLKITQHLTNGKSPPTNLYEAAYGEEGAEETNASLSLAEGLLAIDPNAALDGRKRNRAPLKKKVPSSRKQPSCPVIDSERVPVMPPIIDVFKNDRETSELAKSEDVTCDDAKVEANTCKTSDAVQPTSENKADGDNMDDVIKEELLPEHTRAQFSLGDVVWAKVSGSPWWPGLITTDPESNRHIRQKAKSIEGLLYHLQYFGDTPERAYVDEKNLVLFSGKEQYQNLIRGGKEPGIDPNGKKLSIRRKLRIPWDTGVSQASDARALPLDERLNKFSFAYEDGLPKLSSYMLHNLQQRQQEQSQQDHEELLNPTSLTPPDSSQSSPITVHTLSKPLPSPANSSTSVKKMPLVTKAPKAPTNRRRPSQKKQNASATRRKKATGDPFLQDKTAVSENLAPQKRKYVKSGKYKKKNLLQQNVLLAEIDPQLKASQMKQGKLKQKFPAAPNSLKKKRITASASFAEGFNTELLKPVFIGLKKSSKGSLGDFTEADEPQPHKKAKLVEGLKSAKTTECVISSKRRKKPSSMEVKRRRTKTVCGDEAQVRVRYVWKRKREASSKKNCSSSRIEPETFCVENPDSPSDGAYEGLSNKKSERMGNNKKENVCQVCEKMSEDLMMCEGLCCGSFHRECAGLDESSDKVLCTACRTGVHVCFTCKKSEGEVKRCSVLHCGRFYHEACLRLSALTVFDNRGFRCPLHTCLSCHCSGRATVKATKGKLLRCLRCPVAYHAGDLCIAAGSEMLSSTNIICTNHFNPRKGYRQHTHVNVSWCFMCSNGGRLLCCESCPAAFHPDCLNITMPDGSWFCHDCRAGKKPKYRDIIWVKLGSYRWWPAEIRHPRNIPTNIQHLRHEIGEFPVYFFGSKDFYWTHQGRVFPYMEGDRASRHQRTSIGKVFKNAMLEAEARFNQIKLEREAKEAQENNKKPPPYKFIKINKPFGHVQIYTADISEIPKCNCKPTGDRPCSFESECLNRMLLYECHPQVCPAGARCMNQDFTKRLYPETKIIRTAGKGWGLISLRDIKKGEFVNEYVGELIDEEECRARIKYAQENDITHFYMLTIDKDRIIDAGPKGNFSRFMNHSCQPNCETQKWTVNGDTRVGLFAVCDIPAGTELTFNYNLDCLGNEKTVCRCDAPNCSGFLGDRPKITTSAEPKAKAKLQKKKSKRRRSRTEGKKESEDDCFRCGDGGELVLCDRKACTKAYHLSCLDRTKRPFGRWDCPWHHCDVCGKPSDAFCQLCPNSFCKAHVEGALTRHPVSGQLCCQEHDDVDAHRSALPVQGSSLTTKPAKRRRPSSTSRSTGNRVPKKRPKTQRKQAV